MLKVDYPLVGSGLTRATIARLLGDANREVLVIDRREHVGGNVRDEMTKVALSSMSMGHTAFVPDQRASGVCGSAGDRVSS